MSWRLMRAVCCFRLSSSLVRSTAFLAQRSAASFPTEARSLLPV